MPPKITPPPPPQTGKKDKGKNKGKKRHRINLKGWLKTSADWERFNAWAKINALPKKIPEQEPMVRLTKPLSQLKKRIQILSQPTKSDTSAVCRLDWSVSKAALKAKPSKRIKKLAEFILKEPLHCREFPIKIRKAALSYEPSERIIEISKPHIRISNECSALEVSQKALNHETTARERMMALSKKVTDCPDLLSDEERSQLITPTGIMRSALTYKFTPWMSFLSLPSYRYLKDRTDDNAKAWKKTIIEESDTRGKKALEEKLKKEENERERKKKSEKKKESEAKTVVNVDEVEGEKNEDAAEKSEAEVDKTESEITGEDDGLQEGQNDPEGAEEKDEAEGEKNEAERDETAPEIIGEDAGPPEEQIEPEGVEVNEDKEKTDEAKIEVTKSQGRKSKRGTKRNRKAEEETEENTEESQAEKRREAERNAWRFTPSPCVEVGVKKSALKGKVPPRVNELSKANIRKYKVCRANPFGVRKSALSASVTPRISEIAKPTRPLDPVERPPPREKDVFGRPIFPMPAFGKILPEVKYKEAECKSKEEDESKEKPKKRRAVDPIAFMPTIDPYIDYKQAKRQEQARKKLAEQKNKSSK